MITAPPLLEGAVKATSMKPFPRIKELKVGAPGTVMTVPPPPPSDTGVPETALDDGPEPTAFLATTRHKCDTPFVNPDTTIGLAAAVTETALPVVGVQVAVYSSIAAPPSLAGAEKDTVNRPLETTTDRFVGEPGASAGGVGEGGIGLPGATTAPAVLEKIVRKFVKVGTVAARVLVNTALAIVPAKVPRSVPLGASFATVIRATANFNCAADPESCLFAPTSDTPK